VLLYYPYPTDNELFKEMGGDDQRESRSWYAEAAIRNHSNFSNMFLFAMNSNLPRGKVSILDYGGGGGQFALTCKSYLFDSDVYFVDVRDDGLLDEWKLVNRQIKFKDFPTDRTRFDYIFLNDVFEHVLDPVSVLKQLAGKLEDTGKIFIDTPKQFWIYPITKLLSKHRLYGKVLRGTVSSAHLQIWSRRAFELVVSMSDLKIEKYSEVSEYTMPSDFYLNNMRIENRVMRLAGHLFYRNAKHVAKNKILCLLSK
jgi:2-polyprenyl-3-methyl-5-hydroxy-6-metoxy-1,4-benzoquinol methylase